MAKERRFFVTLFSSIFFVFWCLCHKKLFKLSALDRREVPDVCRSILGDATVTVVVYVRGGNEGGRKKPERDSCREKVWL